MPTPRTEIEKGELRMENGEIGAGTSANYADLHEPMQFVDLLINSTVYSISYAIKSPPLPSSFFCLSIVLCCNKARDVLLLSRELYQYQS